MKSILTLLLFVLPISGEVDDLSKISAAMKAGDVTTLSEFLNDDVEIAILDEEDYYTKAEASDVLKKFFESHKVSGFTMMHKGSSNSDGAKYCIGNLVTNNGKFRVYIYLSESESALKIQELRFEKS